MFNLKDFFFLDEMLTPKVLTILYWLALLYVAVNGLNVMFAGKEMTFDKFAGGVGMIIGGVVAARIGSELLMVVFKINENIQALAERKEK